MSGPHQYRGYVIYFDPPPIPDRSCDWHFYHRDYDGTAEDDRRGDGPSREACEAQINEAIADGPDSDLPYTVGRGHKKVDGRWSLWHREWHPNGMCGDIGQPETGVWSLDCEGKEVYGSHRLIQHGCWDFDAAETLIVRALQKGWDEGRITDLFRNMEDRYGRWPVVKANLFDADTTPSTQNAEGFCDG